MKRAALVGTLFFALIAFGCGFGCGTAYFNVTQPAIPGSKATILFEVQDGDTPSDLGPRLQQAGLIRNATIFTYYVKYIHKISLKTGAFTLSPGYTLDKILNTLETSTPIPQVTVSIPPGMRVLEYPEMVKTSDDDSTPRVPRFHNLPNFNADNFIKIATTGKYTDGTDVSKRYWFVPQLHKDAKFALEGYLYPDTYSFNKTDDERAVINRMLDAFGAALCPGTDDNPNKYTDKQDTCIAHAAKMGKDANAPDIFKVAEDKFGTKDPVEAIYKALTLASLVVRESGSRNNHEDRIQIADILYRRLLASQGKIPNTYDDHCLDADPASWYAYFTDHKPDDGNYWKIVGTAKGTAPDSPYNLYTQCTDLPPGPIASPGATQGTKDAPGVPFLYAATDPNLGQITKAFFYIHDGCLHPHLWIAATLAIQNANTFKYGGKCPTGDDN